MPIDPFGDAEEANGCIVAAVPSLVYVPPDRLHANVNP
jgi:hypothetical protein